MNVLDGVVWLLDNAWGVVISVIPIFTTTNYSQPNTKVFCNKSRQLQSSNFANIAVGGLIGSVIGNKLSDTHGAVTLDGGMSGTGIASFGHEYTAQTDIIVTVGTAAYSGTIKVAVFYTVD